jgi:hypothetical protein
MTNKSRQRARALSKKTGMRHQAAVNQLRRAPFQAAAPAPFEIPCSICGANLMLDRASR